MSQISKRKSIKTFGSLTFAGLTGVAGVASLGTANADEYTSMDVISASEKGSGVDKITTSTANSVSVEKYNELIRSLSNNSVVTVDGSVTADSATVNDLQQNFDKIRDLITQYNSVKSQLDTQAQNYTELTGGTLDEDQTHTIVVDASKGYANVVTTLTNAINNAKQMQEDNKKVIGVLAKASTKQSAEVIKAKDAANAEIVRAAETNTHTDDGIVGNLDKIKRASEDSKASDGVVVDYSATDKVNTVAPTAEQAKPIEVYDIAGVNDAKAKILDKINEAHAENNKVAVDVAKYRDNSLVNIDTINKWLASERTTAENVGQQIDKSMGSLDKIQTYRESNIKKLQEARAHILDPKTKGSDKAKQKIVEGIDQAIKNLQETKVNKKVVAELNKEVTDFGDIGRNPNEVKQIASDITKKNQGVINQNLEKVKANSATIAQKFDSDTAAEQDKINKFVERVQKSIGAGAQVTDDWLQQRQIFQQSDRYKSYIQAALKQTEAEIDGVITGKKTENGITIKSVRPDTSAALASASEYQAQSDNGFTDGFGSPMLPSKNINDFATVRGNKLLNSQRDGGAQAVYDAMKAKVWKLFDSNPVLSDIRNQHFGTVNSSNVLLVASFEPSVTVDLKDSFVSVDKDGNTSTHPMSLKLSLTDENGNSLTKAFRDNPKNAGVGNLINPLYVFYLSVDPVTGALVTGGGYIPTTTPNGIGGGSQSGGGELRLGSADNSASDNIAWGSIARHSLSLESNVDYDGKGLILKTQVAVDNGAGKLAAYAPLYISDIDDGQFLHINKGANLDVLMSGQGASITDAGNFYKVTSSNLGKDNGANGTTNLDSQSVLIFGADTKPDSSTEGVGIGHGVAAGGLSYQDIDVALFAPFGIIGGITPPKVDAHAYDIDTFSVAKPNAKAHTEGKYAPKQFIQKIKYQPTHTNGDVSNIDLKLTLPQLVNNTTEKRASSNTSMTVRGRTRTQRTSSGNSLVVRPVSRNERTSSGNSLVVRPVSRNERTSSGNSLVVREITRNERTSSGNTLVVRTLIPQSVENKETKTSTPVVPVINGTDTNGANATADVTKKGVEVNVSVYADPAVATVADKALTAWKQALAGKNVTLNATITSDKDALNKGVTMAFLDADNTTTKLSNAQDSVGTDDDSQFEMKDLAGLSMTTSHLKLVDADANDKYNRDGSIKSGDVLKNSKYIIQLNTETIPTDKQSGVLAHEIGHLFGLVHDDGDTLMTTFYDDSDFTGEISNYDATVAAAYVLSSL